MNKTVKTLLITFAVLAVIVLLSLLTLRGEKVHTNDEGVVGNTASNLLNKGLFCELGSVVYFANPSDSMALYSMNADESGLSKISSTAVEYINCDGTRLYYVQSGKSSGTGLGYMRKTTGMYSRSLKSSKSIISYTADPVGLMVLSGNRLYYQKYIKGSDTTLYSINIDKSNDTQLIDDFVNPASVYYGSIYYCGQSDDHYLYVYDPASQSSSCLWEHNLYSPVYHTDGWVYFIDLESDYELHRYNPSSGEEMTLSTDRVDFFNVIGNVVYYQVSVGEASALKRVLADGSASDTIISGVYSNLNTTSQYLYFTDYEDDSIMYHAPHSNPSAYSLFTPGKE